MGLRTASVRHPHVEVMAPALTETNQTQSFKLPPAQSASPINETSRLCKAPRAGATCKATTNGTDLNNVFDNLNTLALATELLKADAQLVVNKARASDDATVILEPHFIMSNSLPMDGDQEAKMGLQNISKSAATSDVVDQLFNNFSELPDIGGNSVDIGQNVEDIMQVIKSIENNDQLGSEPDNIFPLSTSDLTGNLGNLEKDFLFNDVMNMSMEDQLIDNSTSSKETHAKELIVDVNKKQAKLERKMDFLLRRLRKIQVRNMGQHISGEVAGVFEHVHRTLRRCKDTPINIKSEQFDPNIQNLPNEPIATIPPETIKPISYNSTKNLVKKLEMTSTLQSNVAARQKHCARYFGSGSIEPSTSTIRNSAATLTTLPQWAPEEKQELQRVAGFLESELQLVQEELDSEATVSSSGGESCDEMQTYNNPHQQYLPIHKRAGWKYAMDRAAIACRWTWLQSQVSDLEYRIRQHSDLHRKIRASKEPVHLGGANPSTTCVNGYRGQLPGQSSSNNATKNLETSATATNGAAANGVNNLAPIDIQCARTRPLVNFRKRKLLQFTGLHAVSKKAARSSSVRCGCVTPDITCALCTGRTDPTHPRDVADYLSKSERLSLLDPAYHPVFSLNEDSSANIHMEAIMRTPEWQQKSSRSNLKSLKYPKSERIEKASAVGGPLEHRPRKIEHRKKYNRLKSTTVSALTAKIKNRFRGRKGSRHNSISRIKKRARGVGGMGHHSHASDGADEEVESFGISGLKYDSASTSPLLSTQSISGFQRRNRVDSYDIDNIVIPYSVAAATRVEKLQYKEILTPKWRIADSEMRFELKNNGIVKSTSQEYSDVEDMGDDAVLVRHNNSEQEEKKKFLSYLKLPVGYGRSRANRRTDSLAESSGANTPDPPMSPVPPPQLPDTSTSHEMPPSPITSPPPPQQVIIAPPPPPTDDMPLMSVLRKRTVSQSRWAKDKDPTLAQAKDDCTRCNTPEHVEIPPYDNRLFPLNEDTFEKMLKSMPDDHKLKTNIMSQDSSDVPSPASEFEDNNKLELFPEEREHDSESTESAFGDEDPNDPEWDAEHAVKELYK